MAADGGVWCWGANSVGQAGAPLSTQVGCARRVAGTGAPVLGLAAGDIMSCVRGSASTSFVECWGDLPGRSPSPAPIPTALATPATGLAVGESHVCISVVGTGVSCVGDNSAGQLGPVTGSTGEVPDPAPRSICAGVFHTCLARADGGVDCWGINTFNQVQPGTTASYTQPQRVALSAAALEVKCGRNYSCARLQTNELWCWGENQRSQLGNAPAGPVASPLRTSAAPVTVVGAGDQHLCFVRSGTVTCRGRNNIGQSTGTTTGVPPVNDVAVGGLPAGPAEELALGIDFSCARYASGEVWCWGLDDLNQLGSADAGGFSPRRVLLMQ